MPRRRRRSQPPEWWPDPEWDLERVAIDRIVRRLIADGCDVTELWHPDRMRDDPRRGARPTTPDAALLVDGRQAAIEIMLSWPGDRGTAAARAQSTRVRLRNLLASERPGLRILVLGVYDNAALMQRPPGVELDEVRQLAAGILEIADRGEATREPLDATYRPAWLDSVAITAQPGQPSAFSVTLLPHRDPAELVAEVLAKAEADKGPQLAPWGLGILGLQRGLDEDLADVVAGLAARSDWPFWRVYWNDASDAHLVWPRPDDHAHDATPGEAD